MPTPSEKYIGSITKLAAGVDATRLGSGAQPSANLGDCSIDDTNVGGANSVSGAW
ncbi:MAG: hypothetical protein ACT4P6_15445 [Gemmatimonadaceae bacterium]